MNLGHLEFSVDRHFISSLQLAISMLTQEQKNVSPWRWITIAIHDAVYCALVMKLSRTDLFGVYPDQLEKRASEFYSQGLDSRSPEWKELSELQVRSKLADMKTLFDRVQLPSGAKVHRSASSAIGSSKQITLLKLRRDSFVHAGDYSLFSTEPEFKEIVLGSVSILQEILSLPSQRHSEFDATEVYELVAQIQQRLELL
jgi:hypothetical protein